MYSAIKKIMAQSIQSIEALIAGPILELQTGILELQTGLQIYLNETLDAMQREHAPTQVLNEGYTLLHELYAIHDNTKPFTERLLVWTRHCCNPA